MKISMVGAGSAVFARQLMTDILGIRGLDEGTFALIDIDAERLDLSRRIVERLIERSKKSWQVVASTDRTEVLAGSDFVINSIEVAGAPNVDFDYDIPLKYGVDQCIGDTIGPGGIFKALRTGPDWLDIMQDVVRLCPDAQVMNYTNPMSILTLAAIRATEMPVVGLCHSVQGTSQQLARYLDVPYKEMIWQCAGLNHNAWFTELRRGDEDLFPRLREVARNPEVYERDPVRFEMLLHLGSFPTESSGHFSEYVPYFRHNREAVKRYSRKGYRGESGFYAHNWPRWQQESRQESEEFAAGTKPLPTEKSHEYAAGIVEAMTFGRLTKLYGNVVNDHLIDNLPVGGCVEVLCIADRRGVQPVHFGRLPEQLAALNRAHMAVHELVVEALLHRDRQAALYALMLDPLTAAVCTLEEIESMFDEMWEAQRPYLGSFE